MRTTRMRARGLAAFATAALVAAGFAGCAADDRCGPAPLTVSPETAAAGELVTVSAGPAGCELGTAPGPEYAIEFSSGGNTTTVADGIPVAADGSFRVALRIPSDARAGEASLTVSPNPLPGPSGDCGDDASCADYQASVTVR